MQFDFDTIKAIVTLLAGLGIFAGGIGFLLSQYKKGSREGIESADKLMNFWKDQAEGYQAAMAEKDRASAEKFEQLNNQLGEIRGQLTEKDRQNKEYLDILQNRDPSTRQFQETMAESMEKIGLVLSDIHVMTKAEHDRDFKVTAQISRT